MKKEKLILGIHVGVYLLVAGFIGYGFVVAREGQEAFLLFLKEDGLAENLTVLFLLGASGIALYRAFHPPVSGKSFYLFTWIFLSLLFFFAAGEEISWGQRIFGFETKGIFQSNNLQQETNLHNLELGGVKINKLIFSQLMGVGIGIYFLLLRPLSLKWNALQRLIGFFHLPLPRWNHVVALIISVILCSQYHLMKAAELRELAFTAIMFLIFLFPAPGREIHTR